MVYNVHSTCAHSIMQSSGPNSVGDGGISSIAQQQGRDLREAQHGRPVQWTPELHVHSINITLDSLHCALRDTQRDGYSTWIAIFIVEEYNNISSKNSA